MIKDIHGQRFGRLIAIRPTEKREKQYVIWECQCDCGKTAYVTSYNLVQKRTKSCGCGRKRQEPVGVLKDIDGQRFGRLTALRLLDERKSGCAVWECKCDCGKVVAVRSSSLFSGNTMSCGCLKRECTSKRQALDLEGQRFGKLTALNQTDKRQRGSILWNCQCDCGNTTTVSSYYLVRGKIDSCGCLKKEKTIEPPKRDLTGQRFGKLVVLKSMAER